MGIYHLACSHEAGLYITPPKSFSIKYPGIIHPENPFSAMVVLAMFRYRVPFELVDDVGDDLFNAEEKYKNITEEIYKEYCEIYKTSDV